MPFDDEIEPISPVEDDLPLEDFTDDDDSQPAEDAKDRDLESDIEVEEKDADLVQSDTLGKIVEEITQQGEQLLSGIEDLDNRSVNLNLLLKKYQMALSDLKESQTLIESANAKKLQEDIETLRQFKREMKTDMDNFLAEVEKTFTSAIKKEAKQNSIFPETQPLQDI
jgi:hypothetical protein